MYSVKVVERDMLSPEEQAEWLRLADKLADPKAPVILSADTKGQLTRPEVVRFLCQQWALAEPTRRSRERFVGFLLRNPIYCVFLGSLLGGVITVVAGIRYSVWVSPPCQVFFGLVVYYLYHKRRTQYGLFCLLKSAETHPPGHIMVDMLNWELDDFSKSERLMPALLAFHDTDIQALDTYQQNLLLEELDVYLFGNLWSSRRKIVNDKDFDYLLTIVQYFAREVTLVRPVPKRLNPLLRRIIRYQETFRPRPIQVTFYREVTNLLQEMDASKGRA